jgi:hypothetical protein
VFLPKFYDFLVNKIGEVDGVTLVLHSGKFMTSFWGLKNVSLVVDQKGN